MSSLFSVLRGKPTSSRARDYQTLPASDLPESSDSDVGDEGYDDRPGTGRPDGNAGRGDDQATYLAFWIMGAGTILGWSGECGHMWFHGSSIRGPVLCKRGPKCKLACIQTIS